MCWASMWLYVKGFTWNVDNTCLQFQPDLFCKGERFFYGCATADSCDIWSIVKRHSNVFPVPRKWGRAKSSEFQRHRTQVSHSICWRPRLSLTPCSLSAVWYTIILINVPLMPQNRQMNQTLYGTMRTVLLTARCDCRLLGNNDPSTG